MKKLKIYIINLKRSSDRKENMQKIINELINNHPQESKIFDFEFFEAVDYKDEKRFSEFDKFYK